MFLKALPTFIGFEESLKVLKGRPTCLQILINRPTYIKNVSIFACFFKCTSAGNHVQHVQQILVFQT